MTNTCFGPFASITIVNGVTPANATWGNNAQTQASVALHGFNPDIIGAGFVLSGVQASGTVGTTTVNISSGRAYVLMSDGTIGCIVVGATTQTTSTPSTTYHLYLQPDGTWYWNTSNSPAANSLNIANVTTNGSGQIATITDNRALDIVLFSGMAGAITTATITKGQTVSNTTNTTIVSKTVPVGSTRIVRLTMEFWIGAGNTNVAPITATATYTDPVKGAQTIFLTTTGAVVLAGGTSYAQTNDIRTIPLTLEVTAGSTVAIKYQNPSAGTISDRVTALIEVLG